MSTTNVALVLVDDSMRPEAIAVAGLLAGYCGSTRRSYDADLRSSNAPSTEDRHLLRQDGCGEPRLVSSSTVGCMFSTPLGRSPDT